ncbi:MAG: MFS transporter [Pseudomonadota bacterium]
MTPGAFLPFLALLGVGTICSSMIIPFMAFFLVEGLGRDPWVIGLYSGSGIILTVAFNWGIARWIDAGARVLPLVLVAACGFGVAALTLSISPSFAMVMSVGLVGFAVSSSAVSTMFSAGGHLAETLKVERSRSNALMRATTSAAWMIGPAFSFLLADQFGAAAVFPVCAVLSLVWLGLAFSVIPSSMTAPAPAPGGVETKAAPGLLLWLAAAYVFCLALAHSLTFTALPLFYVQEVGLPGFAPGMAFSVKTFVEIFAIFATPALIARFGMRRSLLGTTALAVVAILVLASVSSFPQMLGAAALEGLYYGLFASLGLSYLQSFAVDRPAQATAIYWNTLKIAGLVAGPVAGLIAQFHSFQLVVQTASLVALLAFAVLALSARVR